MTEATPKKEWQAVFIKALRNAPNVTEAAEKAGVNRQYVYRVRDTDEAFAAEWDDALAKSVDEAERELFRRAVKGVRKPVYQNGKQVGEIQEYSDTLLIFLLKSHRAERYRDRTENMNVDVSMLSDEAIERLAKGESLFSILANTRAGRKGTEKETGGASGSPAD